jgi:hypothetical protein
MSRNYRRRYVNEVLRIYYRFEHHEPGSNLSSRTTLDTNSPGRLYYYVWLLNHEIDYFWSSPVPFIKAATMLPIVARASDQSLCDVFRSLERLPARVLLLLSLLPAWVLYATKKLAAGVK